MFLRKLRRGILIVTGLSLVFTIGVLAYGYRKRIPKIYGLFDPLMGWEESGEEIKETNHGSLEKAYPLSVVPMGVELPKTNNRTLMKLERHYSNCNHVLEDEHIIESPYTEKNEKELSALFPNWQIKTFTSDQVVFEIPIKGYCPDHYIIKAEEGYLVIFRSDKNTGIPLVLEATTIPVDRLIPALQEQVQEGIVADTIEEVEQIMENLGS